MPIAALSESTARAIRSSLALNDAISVIKELLDNALDANATNIAIEISANTVDVIQVKDNGSGIGLQDRQLLCKRGFTSKIRTLDDLAKLGGRCLGFRGEALASIAELSESVAFTTRVDGETAGTQLSFDSAGKLSSSSSASHPIGTTVRVSQFLKNLPVRKSTALKQANNKTVPNIKKLLFDYAFARPTVKFQFKVLKSKSELKDNWSFAPCKDASNLVLLASKIVGKVVAGQCQQETITSKDGSYTIDSLLLRADADISSTSSSNPYISVDGRPLAPGRGSMKDFHRIYKTYIQNHLCNNVQQAGSQFLLLRLQCPSGSYDVNIDPAKNEVMLENLSELPELFETICKRIYGRRDGAQIELRNDITGQITARVSGFDILLARKRPAAAHRHTEPASGASTDLYDAGHQISASKGERNTPAGANDSGETQVGARLTKAIYEASNHEHDSSVSVTRTDQRAGNRHVLDIDEELEDADELMSPKVTNPFVLAKLNTKIRAILPEPLPTSPKGGAAEDEAIIRSSAAATGTSPPIKIGMLPSPGTSPVRDNPFQKPGPPNQPLETRQARSYDELTESPDDTSFSKPRSLGPTPLEKWTQSIKAVPRIHGQSSLVEASRSNPLLGHTSSSGGKRPFAPLFSSVPSYPTILNKPHQDRLCMPFKKGSSNALNQDRRHPLSPEGSPASLLYQQESSPTESSGHGNHSEAGFSRPILGSSELSDIMDFERRKRDTILHHRTKLKTSGVARGTSTKSIPTRPSIAGESFPDDAYNIGNAAKSDDEGEHFLRAPRAESDVIPPQPELVSYSQNLHWNRYWKALRSLDEGSGENSNTNFDDDDDAAEHQVTSRDFAFTESVSRTKGQKQNQSMLPPNDPRSYLIRLRNSKEDETIVKQRRTKTSKLPFEALISAAATFDLAGLPSEDQSYNTAQLRHIAAVTSVTDDYVHHGPASLVESVVRIDRHAVANAEAKVRRIMEACRELIVV